MIVSNDAGGCGVTRSSLILGPTDWIAPFVSVSCEVATSLGREAGARAMSCANFSSSSASIVLGLLSDGGKDTGVCLMSSVRTSTREERLALMRSSSDSEVVRSCWMTWKFR